MNMRDEGDSGSERYTSWFDRCGFPVSNPLLHNTTWARRDIPFFGYSNTENMAWRTGSSVTTGYLN
jgi:hypothetical protein